MNFSNFLLSVISDFIPLLSENIFCVISVLLSLLRLTLSYTCLGNVPCKLEKTVYSLVVRFSIDVRSRWLIVLFRSLPLLISFLSILSITEMEHKNLLELCHCPFLNSVFTSCILRWVYIHNTSSQ